MWFTSLKTGIIPILSQKLYSFYHKDAKKVYKSLNKIYIYTN